MSTLPQKLLTSAVDCAIIGLVTIPAWMASAYWREASVAMCFIYQFAFRERSTGMRVAKTYYNRPINWLYSALYSLGYASILYSIFFQFDLLLLYGTGQAASIRIFDNTIPGVLTGIITMNREDYIASVKKRCLEALDRGEVKTAALDMMIAMQKIKNGADADVNVGVMQSIYENDVKAVREFIEWFS